MAPADTVDCWAIKDKINRHNGEEYDCLSHVLDHYSTLHGKRVVVLAVHPGVLTDAIAKTDLFKDFGITHLSVDIRVVAPVSLRKTAAQKVAQFRPVIKIDDEVYLDTYELKALCEKWARKRLYTEVRTTPLPRSQLFWRRILTSNPGKSRSLVVFTTRAMAKEGGFTEIKEAVPL
ncbi:hypothetical protein CMEL01_16750 [Colletotrichum melonis]|uniref:Uncharacterized protein n=1 Tax=Colletotrichum melonis TaxID=1209925 RepID=A0AAI9U6A6_9PEZI|nr:hypothetical protein CMEL01_16750 [Colletotrichum melonis]